MMFVSGILINTNNRVIMIVIVVLCVNTLNKIRKTVAVEMKYYSHHCQGCDFIIIYIIPCICQCVLLMQSAGRLPWPLTSVVA